MSNLSPETVGEDLLWSNTLLHEQKAQVTKMRSALIECDKSDPLSVRSTLQNIKALRIYHQIVRLIRYTEEMDKIENLLYDLIDDTLSAISNSSDPDRVLPNLSVLMNLQSNLQKTMIESQKLLDPYLNIKELTYIEVPMEVQPVSDEICGQIMDQNSRKRLREGAQELLDTLPVPTR